MKYFWRYSSPLGEIFMQSDGVNVTALKFGKFSDFGAEFREQNLQIFGDTCAWLDIYFSGISPNFTPKISLIGSDFQLEIWQILMQIPFGATMTYGEIAQKIAMQHGMKRISARAVGGAVGHNHISLIIPCHRVVGANGNLTGYAAGLNKKIKLLELEGISKRFVPGL